jgi:hypothetical protein
MLEEWIEQRFEAHDQNKNFQREQIYGTTQKKVFCRSWKTSRREENTGKELKGERFWEEINYITKKKKIIQKRVSHK